MVSIFKRLSAVLLVWALCMPAAQAKIYVIVSKNSSISSISTGKLKRAYLGKLTSAGGRALIPYEYSSSNGLQKEFLRKVIKLNSSLLMQYRSRLVFSGKGRLPKRVGRQGGMISAVGRNSSAIGFVGQQPSSGSVKVIKTI